MAIAVAVVPVEEAPPSITICGADRYPEPGEINNSLLTVPLAINALATAPVPELLIIRTVGGVT